TCGRLLASLVLLLSVRVILVSVTIGVWSWLVKVQVVTLPASMPILEIVEPVQVPVGVPLSSVQDAAARFQYCGTTSVTDPFHPFTISTPTGLAWPLPTIV